MEQNKPPIPGAKESAGSSTAGQAANHRTSFGFNNTFFGSGLQNLKVRQQRNAKLSRQLSPRTAGDVFGTLSPSLVSANAAGVNAPASKRIKINATS